MTEVEEKGIRRAKVGLILCAVLVVILAVSNVWSFTRVGSLQNQVDTLETDKNALQSQVGSLQTDRSSLEGQVSSLQSEFEQLQGDYVRLNAGYITLNANYTGLSLRFEELSANYVNLTEHFNLLQEDYTALNATYAGLLDVLKRLTEDYEVLTNNYNILSWNYSTLLSTHQTLQEQYFALNDLYQQLQTDYETLLELWNEPLEYVLTPTGHEVIVWLETDQTDAISYDPEKFLCGDFSIMLIQHAKAMHWRTLFTVLEFDYYDENPTGIERHHGNHAHAFVSMFTTEGIIYIEPQTDFAWYIHPIGDPETHIEFSDWQFIDFGEDWFGHIFVQYYNRMGANIEPIKDSPASIEVGVLH